MRIIIDPFLRVAAAALLAGCAVGPRLPTPAADSASPPAHSAPMPRTLGHDPMTQKTDELLAAAGSDDPAGRKHMSHSMEGEKQHAHPASDAPATSGETYTCPMHPKIKADKPGSCPICGMTLVKKKPK